MLNLRARVQIMIDRSVDCFGRLIKRRSEKCGRSRWQSNCPDRVSASAGCRQLSCGLAMFQREERPSITDDFDHRTHNQRARQGVYGWRYAEGAGFCQITVMILQNAFVWDRRFPHERVAPQATVDGCTWLRKLESPTRRSSAPDARHKKVIKRSSSQVNQQGVGRCCDRG